MPSPRDSSSGRRGADAAGRNARNVPPAPDAIRQREKIGSPERACLRIPGNSLAANFTATQTNGILPRIERQPTHAGRAELSNGAENQILHLPLLFFGGGVAAKRWPALPCCLRSSLCQRPSGQIINSAELAAAEKRQDLDGFDARSSFRIERAIIVFVPSFN